MRTASLLLLVLLAGCARSQSQAPPPPSPEVQGFGAETARIGEPTDGRTLRGISVLSKDSFTSVVFELDGEGAPLTEASLAEGGQRVDVFIRGVRMDETGNRPLVDEEGRPFGEPRRVDSAPVASYGRKLVLDDSTVAYEVGLTEASLIRLRSEEEPVRVVLDVMAAP